MAILGSALFFLVAAGIGGVLVPWWISRWDVQAPFFGFPPIRALGALLIVLGIAVLLDSFARFALQGVGSLRPCFRRAISWSRDSIVTCETPYT